MNTAPFKKLVAKKDPKMHALTKRVGDCGLKPDGSRPPYEALAKAIVYQQLNGKAAETIFKRFLALFPKEKFPKPESIKKAKIEFLRTAGLSQAKALAIQDLALKTSTGIVPTKAQIAKWDDEKILETLTSVRGVGPWTVEMYLMFTLGRPDVLSAGDYGLKKGLMVLDGLKEMPKPKDFLQRGEIWAPYRSTASWYLWRAAEGA